NAVDGEETQIVRRELVLDARVAQPDNQFHAFVQFVLQRLLLCWADRRPTMRSYFFSFFSAFSAFAGFSAAGSAPSSPSTSCLPFLMTSGSAGTAPASAATASGVATTSSFTVMTWATGWFASVRNFSFGLCGKSETRNTLPNVRCVTSTSMWLGMSPG